MPDYSRLTSTPPQSDVLSGYKPSSLQALPSANQTPPRTPSDPCLFASLPFPFFSLFFLLQERCMNITAVRRLSSTLSHLSRNIPKMAYQTRIIGVSYFTFVPLFRELVPAASSEIPEARVGPLSMAGADVLCWMNRPPTPLVSTPLTLSFSSPGES